MSEALFVVELTRKWLAHFGSNANEILGLFKEHYYCCYAINNQADGESLVSRITEIDIDTLAVNYLFIPLNRSSFLEGLLR